MDRRTRKTREAIFAAFVELLSKKTFEQITVSEIIYITSGGETTVYIKSPSGVYSMAFDEAVLFIEEGDTATVTYSYKSETGVTQITKIVK